MPNPSTVTESMETKPRLVIVHDTDADGIAAAWCINRLSDQYSSTLLIPQRAGVNEIPEGLTENDSLFLVDRTYPWDMLLLLSQQVFSVTIIDHHKSAMTDFYKDAVGSGVYELNSITVSTSSLYIEYGNLTVTIDTNHAACRLCWDYQYTNAIDSDPNNSEAPWFIRYIEDRDLWAWKLPDSKEISAGLHYRGHTFEQYDMYYQHCTPAFKYNQSVDMFQTSDLGRVVLNTQLQIIKGIAHGPTVSYQHGKFPADHKEAQIDNCKVLVYAVVCCPFTLISDLGNYMLYCTDEGFNQPDVVLCYNKTVEGYVYSIRSKVDMVWLAKKYGGGGHELACGFKSQLPPETVLDMWK